MCVLGRNVSVVKDTQGIPELIETATEKQFVQNKKAKHSEDAKYGWYKYESRFALPVYDEDGEIERYNVFRVAMIIRHGKDKKNICMIS